MWQTEINYFWQQRSAFLNSLYIHIEKFSTLWIIPEVPIMRSNHTRARNIINKTFSNQACSEPVRLAIAIPFSTEQR